MPTALRRLRWTRASQAPANRRPCRPAHLTLLAIVVTALGMGAPAAVAQAASGEAVQSACAANPRPGYASCMALKLVPGAPASATEPAVKGPGKNEATGRSPGPEAGVTFKTPFRGYITPEDLHDAYSLPEETAAAGAQTIAVVDAFDDPTAESDLAVYDEQFGLPACTTANGCLRKVNQQGQASPLPRKNGGWAAEITIDVQMAHAICQDCHVLLVEANNESFASLGAAVQSAVSAGATEISNSYAAPERALYEAFAGNYEHPGIVVAASSGDCGYLNQACPGEGEAAEFPADSPDVVAVGGTTLRHVGKRWTSGAWKEGGSGCSEVFAAPTWQTVANGFSATGCGAERAVADVAAVGNPNTGVDVYDSTPEEPGAQTGWAVYGGTSVSSPIVAAEFALAGGSHGVPFPAATLYGHLGEGQSLYDVVAGKNGSCHRTTICKAALAFDGPTGVGSPLGLGAFAP